MWVSINFFTSAFFWVEERLLYCYFAKRLIDRSLILHASCKINYSALNANARNENVILYLKHSISSNMF